MGYLLIGMAGYLLNGLVFGVPFVIWGVRQVDPAAEHSSAGFRILILPGAVALWPVLLGKAIEAARARRKA